MFCANALWIFKSLAHCNKWLYYTLFYRQFSRYVTGLKILVEFHANRITVDHQGGMTSLAQISHPTTIPFVMTMGGLVRHKVPREMPVTAEDQGREGSQHVWGRVAVVARGFSINRVSLRVIGNPSRWNLVTAETVAIDSPPAQDISSVVHQCFVSDWCQRGSMIF